MRQINWKDKPDEEKMIFVYNIAIIHCQGIVFNEINRKIIPEYVELMKEVIDYVAEKIGFEHFPLHEGKIVAEFIEGNDKK